MVIRSTDLWGPGGDLTISLRELDVNRDSTHSSRIRFPYEDPSEPLPSRIVGITPADASGAKSATFRLLTAITFFNSATCLFDISMRKYIEYYVHALSQSSVFVEQLGFLCARSIYDHLRSQGFLLIVSRCLRIAWLT